jgi:hypothetical protein
MKSRKKSSKNLQPSPEVANPKNGKDKKYINASTKKRKSKSKSRSGMCKPKIKVVPCILRSSSRSSGSKNVHFYFNDEEDEQYDGYEGDDSDEYDEENDSDEEEDFIFHFGSDNNAVNKPKTNMKYCDEYSKNGKNMADYSEEDESDENDEVDDEFYE